MRCLPSSIQEGAGIAKLTRDGKGPGRGLNTETAAIEAIDLYKSYRVRGHKRSALNGLNLRVPRGGVHAFLGPNGAGKTTTIRMILGLVKISAGQLRVFGRQIPGELPEVVQQIGAIVEQPRFFPGFSGRKNLQLLARALGVSNGRVEEVLEQVSLSSRARDRFASYSLGMKQRLALGVPCLQTQNF